MNATTSTSSTTGIDEVETVISATDTNSPISFVPMAVYIGTVVSIVLVLGGVIVVLSLIYRYKLKKKRQKPYSISDGYIDSGIPLDHAPGVYLSMRNNKPSSIQHFSPAFELSRQSENYIDMSPQGVDIDGVNYENSDDMSRREGIVPSENDPLCRDNTASNGDEYINWRSPSQTKTSPDDTDLYENT